MCTYDLNWSVPPLKLIPEVVRELENDTCNYTLVIQECKFAPYWSMLMDMEKNFKFYIRNFYKIQNDHAICRGRGNNGFFWDKKGISFNMIFLQIKF